MALRRLFFILVVLFFGLAFIACGDDPTLSSGSNDDTTDDNPDDIPDDIPDDPDNPLLGDPHLVLMTEAAPTVSYSETVAVRIQYLDGRDQAVPNAFITFETMSDTADAGLSAGTAQTATDGTAEVNILAGVQQVDFQIRISVFNDDAVEPILVTVRIMPKDVVDYLVEVIYEGPLSLGEIEVLLYDAADGDCDDATADPVASPSVHMPWTIARPDVNVDGEIVPEPVPAPSAVNLTYAVGRGKVLDTNGNPYAYFQTYGCVDGITRVAGDVTTISINLYDMWPSIEGTYEINTELNLVDVIPDSAQGTVSLVMEFFTDTGLALLRTVALIAGGEEYYNESPWSALFVLCTDDNITDAGSECYGESAGAVVPNSMGAGLATLLEDLVDAGLGAIPDDWGGETIRDIFTGIGDVFENAESFRLSGSFIIGSDADETGLLGTDNRIVYNQLIWYWDDVDTTLYFSDNPPFHVDDVTGSIVFDPTLDDTYSLVVDPYEMQLDYGQLILWVVEKIVFPLVFDDPDVNSLGAFLDQLIDCEALGAGVPGLEGAIEAACDLLKTQAVSMVDDYISDLTVDLGSYYLMSTPTGDPCPMALETGEFSIAEMGSEDAQCRWDGRIRFDDEDLVGDDVRGAWDASRY